ncbi:HEAT repeat domain-containing protein [Niabella pedocola]|uniref:HEAT repeat domain-containing protein n=1 Tax=Niabella pedocola TaxID=1752077 RepID=A0ABS8PVI6_9BACT|nr:HEAT repeat domain-containing protein [Niabella pedocola]MCD2424930.1 HEAT repeat domain-containing protein [Niabella pedocola]
MDIWQHIKILKQPGKSWFFQKDNTVEKLDALQQIAAFGSPIVIEELIPFLKSGNNELRAATCQTIIQLFRKVRGKNGYYNTLRYCNISKDDIDFYQTHFPPAQYVQLLAIASLNGNGRIREEAVKKLALVNLPEAVPFIVYRLADWVLPIRQVALKSIENYKTPAYLNALIDNLPVFEGLQKVMRINLGDVYQDMIRYILSAGREHIVLHFKKYADKPRYILAKHFSASITGGSYGLELLLTDQHFLIRSLALDHFSNLQQPARMQLLKDPSAKIRLRTLYCFKGESGFQDIVLPYLADSSASVRYFARFTLQHAGINLAQFYHQKLQEGIQVPGALAGLAEVGAKEYAATAEQYMFHPKIKIRNTAFLTLQKLDPPAAYAFALSNLGGSRDSLGKSILHFLARFKGVRTLEKARVIYSEGNREQRKNMLTLFSNFGGWAIIADLIMGTVDEDASVREWATHCIEKWRANATALYAAPGVEDQARALQMLHTAAALHNTHRYFKTDPLRDLHFYLQ